MKSEIFSFFLLQQVQAKEQLSVQWCGVAGALGQMVCDPWIVSEIGRSKRPNGFKLYFSGVRLQEVLVLLHQSPPELWPVVFLTSLFKIVTEMTGIKFILWN